MVTTSEKPAEDTIKELNRQSELLSRKGIITKSLENFGAVLVVDGMPQALAAANLIAPEHLEVLTKEPMRLLGKIHNAGSVFLGQYSPEPLGDYYAGPNHVLPTNGTARFFSPLSVDSFVKTSSYICYTEEALRGAANDIILIAEREKLTAHANAIKVRVR